MQTIQSLPAADEAGCYPTLNQRGAVMSRLCPYVRQFTTKLNTDLPILHIGCGYGFEVAQSLNAGATVYANDMDAAHLSYLWNNTPNDQQNRLKLLKGAFPNDLQIKAETIGAVLAARVFHFFDGDEVTQAAKAIFEMLVKGGKVMITADSPYLATTQGFIPTYESRRSEFEKGPQGRWPGEIDMSVWAPDKVASGYIPRRMLLLGPDELRTCFSAAGFKIDQATTFPRGEGFPDFLKLDGREGTLLTATKR